MRQSRTFMRARIQRVLSEGGGEGGSNFDNVLIFFLVHEGKEDPNANISRPS